MHGVLPYVRPRQVVDNPTITNVSGMYTVALVLRFPPTQPLCERKEEAPFALFSGSRRRIKKQRPPRSKRGIQNYKFAENGSSYQRPDLH
jgi:hypothetical protein